MAKSEKKPKNPIVDTPIATIFEQTEDSSLNMEFVQEEQRVIETPKLKKKPEAHAKKKRTVKPETHVPVAVEEPQEETIVEQTPAEIVEAAQEKEEELSRDEAKTESHKKHKKEPATRAHRYKEYNVAGKINFSGKNYYAIPYTGQIIPGLEKGGHIKASAPLNIPDIESKNAKESFSPFAAEIASIQSNKIVLEFSAVNINLVDVKGQDAIGPLKYMSSETLRSKKGLAEVEQGSILVTDTITNELYPHLSAMGVAAVIVNSIDYALFTEIITLLMPIGIISGFGNLKEDAAMVKYVTAREGKPAIVDCVYKKLMVLDDKESTWLSHYSFDLKKIGIIL